MAQENLGFSPDLGGVGKIKNMAAGTDPGDAVNKGQLDTELSVKQDTLTGGSGVKIENDVASIELSSSAADYSSLLLSNASTVNGDLSGSYIRLSYAAYVVYKASTDGDYDLVYNTGGFSGFYKDNGNGTWDVIFAEDTDGTPNSNNQWAAFRVATNPTTVTGNVTNYILDSNSGVGGLRYDITNGHDQDELGRKVPTATDSDVDFGAGASDSFLAFDGGKLKVQVTQDTAQASTTNILSGGATKTYIDEQDTISRTAANNSYSNASSNYPNNPTNVQSALEEAKILIDSNSSNVSGIQTINTTQSNQISAHSTVLGVGNGDTSFPALTGGGASFVTGSVAQDRFQSIGDSILGVYGNVGTINGLAAFETDFGTGFVILPNNSSAKLLFQAIEAELQTLASGAGATWAAGVVQSVETSNIADLSNPGTDTFGGETLSQGDVFLAAGQTAQSENGFYVFDTTSTALVRWADADESSEFIQNRSVQIVSDGTEWAYKGIADPTVDTNVLPFEKIRESIIADQAISEAKLATALANKINAKLDDYEDANIDFVADVPKVITHNLGKQVPVVFAYDSSGNRIYPETDVTNLNTITLTFNQGYTAAKVRVI